MNRRFRIVAAGVAGVAVLGVAAYLFLFENEHVAKGRRVFGHYCAHCHGDRGRGNGFNARNLDPHPRDLTDRVEPYMAELTNPQIHDGIKYGVAGSSPETPKPQKSAGGEEEENLGSSLMPYWGYTLSDEEIWSLVAYLRTLHKNDAPPVEFPPTIDKKRPTPLPVPKPDLTPIEGKSRDALMAEGRRLYDEKYACLSCHQIDKQGGMVGPSLDRVGFRLNPQWIFRWIKNAQAIKPGTKMPTFAMPDEEALAITAYLNTLGRDTQTRPGI